MASSGSNLSTIVPRIKLGKQGLEVSAQGLGCMGMSAFYGPVKLESNMIEVIHHAVFNGITFLDTSDVYGPFTNEVLIGNAYKDIKALGSMKVEIATMFGVRFVNGRREVRGDPKYVRQACEASLKRLGVDCIDLYYQHRVDTTVPIEVTIGELKKLVEEGKIKYIGLSEASASTIKRAHKIHPISAVQLEWCLWSRDAEEEIIPTCRYIDIMLLINQPQAHAISLYTNFKVSTFPIKNRDLGIGIVAYSPLGRGFFGYGPKMVDDLEPEDFRRLMPRFQPDNLKKNAVIYERIKEMATRKGCTPSQLALAWVHHQGTDVCPIPGTTKIENLNQNIGALSVKLTPEEMSELETYASNDAVNGDRYAAGISTWKEANTPPLSVPFMAAGSF